MFRQDTSRPTFPVKVKAKFTIEKAMKAQRGSRGIDLIFL
jgi:hypothetical protein